MPIQVTCPGCKATFNVSDKYAGRQGPCPKCKAVITIPKLEAAKKVEEVKIAAPEEVGTTGKSATGRPVLKPIERQDAKLTPAAAGAIVGVLVVMFVAAWFAGPHLLAPDRLLPEERNDPALASTYAGQWWTAFVLRAVGLVIVGFPIVWAGYLALRDDELEPFRGRSLLVRSLICLAVYLGMWGGYGLLPDDLHTSGYAWVYIALPFLIVGSLIAYFCFDFDVTSAVIHCVAFITLTLMLGMTAGLTMPWSDELQHRPRAAPADRPIEIVDESGKIQIHNPDSDAPPTAAPTPTP
jgi:hypothetical protein